MDVNSSVCSYLGRGGGGGKESKGAEVTLETPLGGLSAPSEHFTGLFRLTFISAAGARGLESALTR